jgi:hypothetical protein
MKVLIAFSLIFLVISCNKTPERVEQNDQYEEFLEKLKTLAQKALQGHGECQRWVAQEILPLYKRSETGSLDEQRGHYHRLLDPSEKNVRNLIGVFPINGLHRMVEAKLYDLPLNYPTSDRNLNLFLDITDPLPQCETSFEEYGLLDALLTEYELQNWSDKLKKEVDGFLQQYLENTLNAVVLSYGNLLTNIALMRRMAELELLPKESFYPLSGLLNEAERFHQNSMQAMTQLIVSTDRPTIQEFRSLLVLHRDRRRKTDEIADKLKSLLAHQKSSEAEVI